MSEMSAVAATPKNWKEVGLRVGAWGILLLICLMTFVAVPLLALSI